MKKTAKTATKSTGRNAKWTAAEHPRQPKGSDKGGEFAPAARFNPSLPAAKLNAPGSFATVNAELRRQDVPVKLQSGRGYQYMTYEVEGQWDSRSEFVYRMGDYTNREWLELAHAFNAEKKARR